MHLNTAIRLSSLLTLNSGGSFQKRNSKHSAPGNNALSPYPPQCVSLRAS